MNTVQLPPKQRAKELFYKATLACMFMYAEAMPHYTEEEHKVEVKKVATLIVKEIMTDGKREWAFTAHEPYENTKHYEYYTEVLKEIEAI